MIVRFLLHPLPPPSSPRLTRTLPLHLLQLVSMIALNVLHPVWLIPRGPAGRKSSAPSTDFVEMKQARSI